MVKKITMTNREVKKGFIRQMRNGQKKQLQHLFKKSM